MTLQERIDELVAQHGSLRAVARVTEIDVGYLSRLRAYANVNPGRASCAGWACAALWPMNC